MRQRPDDPPDQEELPPRDAKVPGFEARSRPPRGAGLAGADRVSAQWRGRDSHRYRAHV